MATKKLSQIAASPGNITPTGALVGVDSSGSTDLLYTPAQIAAAVGASLLPLATSNLTWYVATTGNDANAGTSGSPFLTIQKALDVAATYNYQLLYAPTINIANGTYNSSQNILPLLINCNPIAGGTITGNLVTPTNVVVNNGGTAVCFTAAMGAIWFVQGMRVGGTFGAFLVPTATNGSIGMDKVDFHGGGSAITMGPGSTGIIYWAGGGSITVSSSAMDYFIQSNGFVSGAAGGTLTFLNAITFAINFMWLDCPYSFFAGANSNIVGASNVTCSGAALHMSSGAVFESFGTGAGPMLIDGAVLSRSNFPGHAAGFAVEVTCIFAPDNISAGYGNYPDNPVVALMDPTGTVHADYGIAHAGDWTFTTGGANKGIFIEGSGASLFLNDTQTHGALYQIFAAVNGTAPYYGIEDLTTSGVPVQFASSYDAAGSFQLRSGSMFGWSSSATFADGAAMDTGISRVAPVSSVPTVAFGNGTAADASATIKAKTKAGAPSASDVPAGTWVLIRDTSGATTKLYYNNGGSLQSVALT